MVVFLAQISSLIFGNGDRLDKKSWLKSRDFKAWCISGENKPESSETVLNYFHHMNRPQETQRNYILLNMKTATEQSKVVCITIQESHGFVF